MNFTGTFHLKEDKITFQRTPYIEDGWIVEVDKDGGISLFEIPEGGGNQILVRRYNDLISAINAGINLS